MMLALLVTESAVKTSIEILGFTPMHSYSIYHDSILASAGTFSSFGLSSGDGRGSTSYWL